MPIIPKSQGGGSGTPALPFTSVQFNDSGSFGGDAGFVYDKSANRLGVDFLAGATVPLTIQDDSSNSLMDFGASNTGAITFTFSSPYFQTLTSNLPAKINNAGQLDSGLIDLSTEVTTAISGLLKGNGSNVVVAIAGTDYTALAFKTITDGFTNIVADSAADTLTILNGGGLSIALDSATDTITFTNGGVTNLASSNTSITFDSPSGTVDAIVNEGHAFTWTNDHTFKNNINFFPSDSGVSSFNMLYGDANGVSQLKFFDDSSKYVGFQSSSTANNNTIWNLPNKDANGFWYSDGLGNLSIQGISVDGVTITGNGTIGNPLVAVGGGSGTVTSVASADGSITVANPTTTVDLAVVKAPKWTTARNLAGNSVDGSTNVAFANKFIVQGTTDAGLSAAQFLGALGTGIVKNTTTTGVLSIAVANTDYTPAVMTTGGDIIYGGASGVATRLANGSAGQVLQSNGTTLAPTWVTPNAGTVTSVSGTANRITSSGGATPVIDISASYVGQSSITTLGTIATGIWNGTVITGTYGGTGVNNGTKTFTYLKNISFTAADDTGVYTLPTGTKTLLATDGAGTALTGIPYTLTGTANQVILSAGTGNITFSLPQSIGTASSVTFGNVTDSGLTAGRVTFAGTAGLLSDDADMTFSVDTLTVTKIAATSFTGNVTLSDVNMVLGTTTGTKFGTATNQKLAFFNSTPIVQPTGDIITALQNLGLVASGTVSASLVVGTSAITSGAGTRLLYETSGNKLGEISGATSDGTNIFIPTLYGSSSSGGSLTLSSTTHATKGNILFGTSAYDEVNNRLGLVQTTPTSTLHLNFNQNAVTQADANGILLANSTAATVGLQSISPPMVWQGNGWKTTATAGSQDVRFRADVLPVQGTTNPSATWQLAASINGGAYANAITVSSAGALIAGNGSASAPSYAFASTTNMGFFRSGSQVIGVVTNGTERFDINNSGIVSATTGSYNMPHAAGSVSAPTYSFAGTATSGMYLSAANEIGFTTNSTKQFTIDTSGNINLTKKAATYNGVATTGWGVPAIYGTGRSTAQTAAVASVATYTVGAADGSFLVSANILVTTSTVHNFTATVTYTDEGNTSRTVTMQFSTLAGAFVTAMTNAQGAVPYEGVPLHIRCKASTAITIATTGTFTTVTYNCEGMITQIS